MGGHRGGPGGLIGEGLDVVATTLGITPDEVRTALENGQSLADLAVSKGKTAQDVIDAVVAEATTKINAQVTDGHLTQAQADQLIAGLTTGVTAFVNGTGGHGFGFPGSSEAGASVVRVITAMTTMATTTLPTRLLRRLTPPRRPTPSPAEVLGSAGMATSPAIPASQNVVIERLVVSDRRR